MYAWLSCLSGPSVLEVFNTLLRHLRISVDTVLVEGQRANDERHFQEAIINTIGGNYCLVLFSYLAHQFDVHCFDAMKEFCFTLVTMFLC